MVFLALVGYLIYKNCLIAKSKGKNMTLWGILTFLSIILCELVGMYLLMAFFYPEYLKANDISKSAEMANNINNNFSQSLFLLFCGFGGYLIIRYVLERARGMENTEEEMEE